MGTPGGYEAFAHIVRSLRAAGLPEPEVDFFRADSLVGRNVIVDMSAGAGRVVVVMAYYDGLGIIDGSFYPSADAGGSGAAALLEILRSRPQGPLLFAFVDGHNNSYAGARELLRRRLEGRSVREVVCIDCIGTTLAPVHRHFPNFLIALGASESGVRSRIEPLGPKCGIELYWDYYQSRDFTRLFYRRIGDHTPLLDAGLPVVVFTSGITMNTNRRTDTAESLDYPVLARRVDLIEEFIKSY